MLDIELLKLPSIGPEENIPSIVQNPGTSMSSKAVMSSVNVTGSLVKGSNRNPKRISKPVKHPTTLSSKLVAGNIVNKEEGGEKKIHFNALLNKTRIDNLPPLQELSVFEQSFESRRKLTKNHALRSRSK